MSKILITGALGQLGSEIRTLISKKISSNIYFFTDIAELNITDANAVDVFVKENKINIIVNCAAYTAVDKAEDEVDIARKINATAAGILADACAKYNMTLFHISTDYVFDGESTKPYTENDKTNPLGVYGITKLEGENLIHKSGCNYIIIRTAWLYSAFGKNFVKTIGRLSGEKETLKVVFDQVGSPTYAQDLASVILQIIEQKNYNNKKDIYHFTDEGVCSWFDFAIAINELFEHSCHIEPCHSNEFFSKVTRPSFSVLDKTKIKKTFGINIPYWRDSLRKCINILKQE